MPARTGTDGRGGRLRAVQATASASTSRATRNFISNPLQLSPRPEEDDVSSPPARDSRALLRGPSCLVPLANGKPWPSGSPLQARGPHPDWGSRKLRDNSFILVITAVDPGDDGPPRRSGPESTCWRIVGGEASPVVDTWTSRRPCTWRPCRPRAVPRPPPAPSPARPQVLDDPPRAGPCREVNVQVTRVELHSRSSVLRVGGARAGRR